MNWQALAIGFQLAHDERLDTRFHPASFTGTDDGLETSSSGTEQRW